MADDLTTNSDARPPPRQTLPKSARLRSRADFDRVFKQKHRASDAVLTVYAAGGGIGGARLGIAASRRVGNAVTRNRLKRLVREVFRRYRQELPAGTDWVVVPARAGVTFQQMDNSLRRLSQNLVTRLGPATGVPGSPERPERAQKESTECLGGEPGAFRRGKKPNR